MCRVGERFFRSCCWLLVSCFAATVLGNPADKQSAPWAAPALRSESALVVDESGKVLYAKGEDTVRPIASITKLMTAVVILDAGLDLDQPIRITRADADRIRNTGSRLLFDTVLDRGTLLKLALMASENRAANALGRTYPGGMTAFIAAMNRKAAALGMVHSRFRDPAGLDAGNVATASELLVLVDAARRYPLIVEATTSESMEVLAGAHKGRLRYVNTNRLLRNENWQVVLGKTGFTNAAGRCFVMQARADNRQLSVILLNSYGKLTPFGDSNRILRWLRAGHRA